MKRTSARRTTFLTTATGAVTGALVVAAVSWSAATATADDTIVSVLVRGADGRPAAKVPVTLYSWPSPEELADLRVGEKVERVEIGRRVTSRDGRVDIDADDVTGVADLMAGEDLRDIDVVADLGSDGIVTRSLTLAESHEAEDVPSSAGVVDSTAGTVIRAARVTLSTPSEDGRSTDQRSSPAAGRAAEDSDERPGGRPTSRPDAAARTSPVAASGQQCPSSGTTLIESLGLRWVNVGNAFVRATGKETEFQYSTQATTTLGTAVEVDGIFTVSDSVSRAHTLTVVFPKITTPRTVNFDTQFSYGKYCTYYPTRGVSEISVRPIKHEGGARVREGNGSLETPYCTYFPAGSAGIKDSTEAVTWKNGAKLDTAIGIDLSSQTGFSTAAKQKWTFKTAGDLCGRRGYPGGDAQLIAMQAPA